MSSLFLYAAYLKDLKKNGRTGLVSSMKKQSYVNRLSSLLQDPNLINKQRRPSRTILPFKNTFRVIIAEKGGWDPIVPLKKSNPQTREILM
jgi:hypothetical protein